MDRCINILSKNDREREREVIHRICPDYLRPHNCCKSERAAASSVLIEKLNDRNMLN